MIRTSHRWRTRTENGRLVELKREQLCLFEIVFVNSSFKSVVSINNCRVSPSLIIVEIIIISCIMFLNVSFETDDEDRDFELTTVLDDGEDIDLSETLG